MLKELSLGFSAWKLSTKRFGPVGGMAVAAAVVLAYVSIKHYLRDEHPELERTLEELV